jgi:hypothetical protein
VNAPGRDPIVTRILWLEGLEEQNRNAHSRAIYLHGTPEEERIGEAVSWGCIRMRSRDVIALFDTLPSGAPITIVAERLPRFPRFDPQEMPILAKAEGSVPPLLIADALTRKTPEATLSIPGTRPGSGDARQAMKGSILFSGLDAITNADE